MTVPRVPHILYGGDYNPDQWPEETWPEDARLMNEAGVNLVSLGIFSWARLEPRPGAYDFDWLDRIMDILHAHGVAVALATATASPPPWLAHRHPESLPVTADGTTLWPGARQHYCPSSQAYRDAAAALVGRLAARYGAHPALALWHINNEYGCHVARCYCNASAAAFRVWLQRRYGTIEGLNEAWATAFWSQRYDAWEEINAPRTAPSFVNPTQQLDYKRFSSDALLDLYTMERDIVRAVTPTVPATTNFVNFALDYWRWAEREDVVSFDSYPDPSDPRAHITAALHYDLMRSLKAGQPWVLMEQSPSLVNWRARNVLKRPGQMRLWSLQAVARGADGILFFQWRQSRAGAEKFHGALLPHAGVATRVWREVAGLGVDIAKLDAVRGALVPAEVAIVLDWDSWWALEHDSKPSSDVRLMDQVSSYYDPLHRRNIPVAFVSPTADLTAYKVLLVPNLYLVQDGASATIERFVARGGRLVMSFFSGIVDANEHVLLGGYPAPFRAVLGIRVEEFDPFAPGQVNSITNADGTRHACDLWADVIDLEGASALARFDEDFYAGRPAVTRHSYHAGTAYYLGTRPDPAFMDALLARICHEAGVAMIAAPAGVEVVRRSGPAGTFLFALNHNAEPVEFELEGPMRDILTGTFHTGAVALAPRDAVVLVAG